MPRYSIIIPTLNGGALWARALDALLACDGIEECELLVVDSGSTDGSVEVLRQRLGVAGIPFRLIEVDRRHFSHGGSRNLGAASASGEVLIFLVQDAVASGPGLLRRLTAPLAEPATAGVYGRQVAQPSANPVERFYLLETYPAEPGVKRGLTAERVPIRSIFFSNVCSAVRREVFEEIRFDEELVMSEDQKWAKEALAAGYQVVYEPAAVVRHSHHYSLRRLFQRNFDSGYSLVGIVHDSPLQMLGYELRHLGRGIAHLLRQRQPLWIPYLLVWEVTRAVGFAAGRRAGWLPAPLRRALGAHKDYWRRQTRSAG